MFQCSIENKNISTPKKVTKLEIGSLSFIESFPPSELFVIVMASIGYIFTLSKCCYFILAFPNTILHFHRRLHLLHFPVVERIQMKRDSWIGLK